MQSRPYVAVFLTCIFLQIQVKSQDTLQTLLKNSIEVKSIDPMNEDFTDLIPLINKIGTANVVVLGEISHTDGLSLAFKSRMVKFLHQKMGFDVVTWEAGALDGYNLNAALRSSMPLAEAKRKLLSGGWINEEEVQPVFEYARSSWNTTKPLEMAGFDFNRPPFGTSGFFEILQHVYTVFPFLVPSADTAQAVDSLIKLNYGFIFGTKLDSIFTPDQRKKAIQSLHKIANWLETHHKETETFFSKKEINLHIHLIRMAILHWQCREAMFMRDDIKWNTIRDSVMDLSLKWQMENLFPGRKIIIWAATAHFTRNTFLKNVEGTKKDAAHYKQAGDYLFDRIGENMYTIACTTSKGEMGNVYPGFDDRNGLGYAFLQKVPVAPAGSYESLAAQTKKKYLFTDLRNANGWLKNDFLSTCLGLTKTTAPWSKLIDALFFIEEMKPVRKISKGH
jgi:erythromycin esterase